MPNPGIARVDISGLVLAGGQGSRMGGVDKGLLVHQGQTLVQRALQRLAPQVGPLMISANRHLEDYARLGVPVWPDERTGFAGPLAGFFAGLSRCTTPWLVTVPCDSPDFPLDLVARLADAVIAQDADLAMPVVNSDEGLRRQPVFCLLRVDLLPSLRAFVDAGGAKIAAWALNQRHATVSFDNASAFANANSPSDLAALAAAASPPTAS